MAALRVVLAARAFGAQTGHGPAAESDLVPAWLAAWPRSALNLEPLPWDREHDAIRLFDADSGEPCLGEEDCLFAWAAPGRP